MVSVASKTWGRDSRTAYSKAARKLLPEAVTVLGLPRLLLIEQPASGALYSYRPNAGTVLVSDHRGRRMFILKPIRDAGKPKRWDQALKAEGLYERFTNRASDGFYNCFIPSMRKPRYRGRLVLVRYLARKDLDDESAGRDIEWEHYFEAPDYADLWSVGRDQFYVPPGPWKIEAAGIMHAEEPAEDEGDDEDDEDDEDDDSDDEDDDSDDEDDGDDLDAIFGDDDDSDDEE